ncbi:response regulator [Hymenobacter sp. 15J16-1T3B]|jgi:two-component system, cell cycle response regulator DivK|uniref:Response regulator n=2 Tax=Hymenobacter TaxID=89966 RepID=A0A328BTQ9_9BACT|nr:MULTISPECIES: response regulator [Hymenobacter]MCC3159859.1 response regulator [Hymenobacter sp. 15J16-1T3B]RAK70517.1 response regulator [Hymenobacter edaphi]TLM91097.1 response regulator [Hymenobacter jeollabukensis]
MSDSKTILIAEDSSVILNLTKKILELQKYRIVSAKNGGEVMKQLEAQPIDCILLDINIPVKDGMTVAREIRQSTNDKIRQVPIIAITGNANNYSMDDFREAGVTDYLPKPLDFDALVRTVKQHIG